MSELKCVAQVADHSGFHWHKCGRPAKETILGAPVCGVHARTVRKHQETFPGHLPYNIKPEAK